LALAEIGPPANAVVPGLVKLLARDEPEVRLQALVTLGEIGPGAKAAVSKIVQALQGDKIEGVRFAAAYALGQIGVKDERAITALRGAMKSDQPFLQVIGAWALVRLDRDDQAVVAEATMRILAGLQAEDVNARRAAARALAEINPSPEVVAPVLVKAIHDADPTVIANAVDALASLGPKIVPRLINALKNKDLRLHAARVLGRIGPEAKEAAPALAAALDDAEGEYRREVQFALGAIGPAAAPAVPSLIESLDSDDDQIRNSAVYALGRIGPAAKTSASALTKLLSSEDDFVRFSALWALVRIEPNDKQLAAAAVPAMVVLLADSRELVRAEAATTLGELGPAAKAALPDLKKASADANPTVSAAAKQSIERISGK
jgi:HEAT repeat protein